jgi:RNA polymerase sigma factor (sigma-70 family)
VQSFEQVVTAHGATVLRVCRAVLGPVDADDAWSETFLAALRAYPDLPEGANVEAWLVTIAHRKAIDVRRRADRAPQPRTETAATAPTPPGDVDVEESLSLYDALRELPERQRLCVAYHHLGGLPFREVAAIVGGNEAAARRASADGIHTLRTRLLDGAHHQTVTEGAST